MSFQSLTALKQTTYDRADCSAGIVHVGYGAFHRAHQAVYIDDYMQATGDLSWGIVAVNLRAQEAQTFKSAQRRIPDPRRVDPLPRSRGNSHRW